MLLDDSLVIEGARCERKIGILSLISGVICTEYGRRNIADNGQHIVDRSKPGMKLCPSETTEKFY